MGESNFNANFDVNKSISQVGKLGRSFLNWIADLTYNRRQYYQYFANADMTELQLLKLLFDNNNSYVNTSDDLYICDKCARFSHKGIDESLYQFQVEYPKADRYDRPLKSCYDAELAYQRHDIDDAPCEFVRINPVLYKQFRKWFRKDGLRRLK